MAKSIQESAKYRALGNSYFEQRRLGDSLEAYNNGLLYAPGGSESYAYACGNRSAVFYELEAFEECLRDINRALNCAICPASLKEKLNRRKSKCESMMVCKELSNVSLTKRDSFTIPDLYGGSNPNLPGVSQKIGLVHSAESGRRLVALEDIEAGSVVISEHPYASILLDHTRETHCHDCHEILPLDFIPCDQCSDVRFCSETCLEDHRHAHTLECGEVGRLYQTGLAYLAYKIFTVSSVKDISEYFRCPHWVSGGNESSNGVHDSNTSEIYDGGYRCVWNLMTHHENVINADLNVFKQTAQALVRLVTSRKHWTAMAVELVKISKNVCQNCKIGTTSTQKAIGEEYLTSLFLRFIELLICNGHAICALVGHRNDDEERATGATTTIDIVSEMKIASAIYSTASLMNHSCKPNIFSSFIGRTLIVRTSRRISAGEEIFNCYGPQFGRMLREERREALKQQYYFDCNCCACTGQEYIEREAYFKAVACPQCPRKRLNLPPTRFTADEVGYIEIANAMFENEDKNEYECENCHFRKTASPVLKEIKEAETILESALGSDAYDVPVVEAIFESFKQLTNLLYHHNKELSERRDGVAGWLVKKGRLDEAVFLLDSNLPTVDYMYGGESLELANEIIKLIDVVLATADKFLATQRGRLHLRVLFEKAEKIFEIHYGQDCGQITELKRARESMSILL